MRVALYIRTSTDKQLTGLEAQERALKQHCKSKEILNFSLYKEFGVSGSKSSRPELDEMMKDIRDGEIQTVIVYSFSRFARSTKHLLDALDEFHSLGVNFISITENIDTSTPMGKAMFTIISALSQLERELISERVKNGLMNAKAKGKKIGRKKTRNSKLIQELHKQKLSYRKIAEITGHSISTIHNELKGVQKC